jgi:hypothetical protein
MKINAKVDTLLGSGGALRKSFPALMGRLRSWC